MSIPSKRHFCFRALFCLFLFAAFFAAAPAEAGFFDGKLKYYTLKTEHFFIHFPQNLSGVAEEMRELTEKVHDRMTARLEWKPGRRTHVVLTDKSETSNGVASVLPDNYILLYAAIPTPDSSLDHYRDYYEYLFTHEYTHILHIDQHHRMASPGRVVLGKVVAPNGATPAWMREGMAVYEESLLDEKFGRNHSDFTEMFLRSSYYEDRFPRIDQIAGLSENFPAGMGPYLFGGKFFEWIAREYGEDRIYQYQKDYASSLWLYSLNNKARRVFGKSFYKLWKEFKADLAQKYEVEKTALAKLGLTSFRDVVNNKNSQHYFTPHPSGKGYAYYESGLDESPEIVIDLKDGTKPHRLKRRLFGQMSFSPSGKYLSFASLAAVERKTAHAETYYYDLKKRKLFRVNDEAHKKKAMRAMDPDFSPVDGGNRWLVMVRNFQNTDQLYVFDLFERHGYVLTDAPAKTQFSNPRFSPDGRKIVVSRKDPATGQRDIVIYSNLGRELTRVTNDAKSDLHPVFSRDGRKVYFSSARTGIFNIFSYDLKSDKLKQLTNVLTGVFQPMPAKSGEIYVQNFAVDQNSIRAFDPRSASPRLLTVKKAAGRVAVTKAKTCHSEQSEESPCDKEILRFAQDDTHLVQDDMHLVRDVRFALDDKTLRSVSLDEKNSIEIAPEFAFQNLHFDFAEATSNPDPEPSKAPETETPTQDPTRQSVPDSEPVLPVQTDGREPQTRPQEKTLRHKEKKIKQVAAATPEKAAPKTYPSAYKKALTGRDSDVVATARLPEGAKKYTPFPHILRPAYIIPNVQVLDNAVFSTVQIGRVDPLYRHSWIAFADYRTDAAFVGGGGTYIFSRYDPTFYIGGLRYAVDWGNITTLAGTTRFFEERWQTYTGASWRHKNSLFNASYFYEHRAALTNLAGVNLINMKPYAGIKLQYTLSDYKKFPASISQEDGYHVKLTTDVVNEAFMSDDVNEEVVSTADFRYYFEMPWSDHHVFAIRAAGGWKWGDRQQFGTFRLGGPLGEGVGAARYSARVFPLRGLSGISYGGDRVAIFSGEYRLPVVEDLNGGIGTWPIFLDKLYMNFYVDGGDIKYSTDGDNLLNRMLLAVGAELRGDVVLGYGLPITARLGYGIILTNRDRLGTLTDAITGASLKYGSTYISVGTSF